MTFKFYKFITFLFIFLFVFCLVVSNVSAVEDNSTSDNISSTEACELKDKQTELVGTSLKEYYDNPIEVSAGTPITVQASAPSTDSFYLQLSNDSKEFNGFDGIVLDSLRFDDSWKDIYAFTPGDSDVGKIYSFRLFNFKLTYQAYIYYKIVKKDNTNISLNIVKNESDNTKITITPIVKNQNNLITTPNSVKIYINNEEYGDSIQANESIVYTNNSENTYSIYAVFTGDENNSKSTSDIYFFTLLTDKQAVNLTLTLNETNIVLGESLTITPLIKNAEGIDIGGSVDIYDAESDEVIFSNVSNGKSVNYTPNLQQGIYHEIYAVFRGDETYSKTTSQKFSYKIKKSLKINLTVENKEFYNLTVATPSQALTFTVECDNTTPINLKIFIEPSMRSYTINGNTCNVSFSSNHKGLNQIYVAFEGDEDYTASRSNTVEVLVNEKCSYDSYYDITFTPNNGIENNTILINPKVLYNSIEAVGTLKIFNSSSSDLIASVDIGNNDSFRYTIPEYLGDESSTSIMLYYTFEGYDSEKYNYYNCSGDFYFYIMNENSLKINAISNNSDLENDIIFIDENESVILSVENLTFYNKYSKLNISIYIEGIDDAVGEFPTSGNFNSELENYTLTFNSDAYPNKEYKIYAVYSGYSNSLKFISNATSNVITVIINQNTNISLTPSVIDVKYGESENIEVKLSDNIIEGNITFYDNLTQIEGFVEVSPDTIFTTQNLSIGNHIISVKYNGAKGFNPSTSLSNVSVNVRPYLYIDVENSQYLDDLTAKIITSTNGNYTLKIKDQQYNFEITNYTKTLNLKSLPAGLNYNATITYDEDMSLRDSVLFNISKIDIDCAVNVYGNNTKKGVSKLIIITIQSTNATGNFTAIINNKKYTSQIINNKAVFSLTDLAEGSHKFNINYSGDDNYVSKILQSEVTVLKTPVKLASKIIAKKQTFKVKKSKKYAVVLKTKSGKVIVNVKVTLKIKGKTYSAKTNKKGKATFNLKKLNKKGTYKAKILFKGNSKYNSSSKTIKIKVKK